MKNRFALVSVEKAKSVLDTLRGLHLRNDLAGQHLFARCLQLVAIPDPTQTREVGVTMSCQSVPHRSRGIARCGKGREPLHSPPLHLLRAAACCGVFR